MSIEVMKLALEALDNLIVYSWDDGKVGEPDKTEDYAGIKAMEALRIAIEQAPCVCGEPATLGVVHRKDAPCFHYIEQAEKQEPIADVRILDNGQLNITFLPASDYLKHGDKLYTAPSKKEWVGLTDREISKIYNDCDEWDGYKYERAIEAKLKEKNT